MATTSRSSQRLLDVIRTSCRGNQGVLQPALLNEGLRSLDIVDLVNVFKVRPFVVKTVPFFLRGTFKNVQDCSQRQEIRRGQHEHDDTTEIRGRKLFFLLSRILFTIERRAACAFELCQLEELSSARQALEGPAIAPGDSKTEKLLKDETCRPRMARIPMGD